MTLKIMIVGRETVVASLAKDAGTFAMFASLIGLGRWLDSGAMQWAGFLIGSIWLMQTALGDVRKKTFSFDEARKEIDRLEARK